MLYPNLTKAMKADGVTKTDIATLLNIHFNTVTAKLEGESAAEKPSYQIGFSLIEAMIIKNVLFKEYDFNWLFEYSLDNNQAS